MKRPIHTPWPKTASLPLLIALALAPTAFVHAEPFAYITNQGSHDVSVIDLATQKVVATVPVGRSPAGVVASSRAGRVFVSNPDSKTISVIDMHTQKVVDTLVAGDGPVGIDVAPDGSYVYAADWYRDRLLVFDVRARALDANHPNPGHQAPIASIKVGKAPAGVAASDRTDFVFVAERDDDSVALVDVSAHRVHARVRVGSHPFALLFDAPRQRLYALNVQSNDVCVLDTRDPNRLEVIATIQVGKAPYGAALSADGMLLYVTNQHDDTVSVIDASSLTLLRTLTGFAYPEGVAAHADRIYVVNWMDDNVSVLDARSGLALGSIATGKNSRGFGAFIGAPAVP
ncbi:MAG: YncE family protein [Rhodoferax sp.]|nr:YncE family protein [Rhodoferax sp.]